MTSPAVLAPNAETVCAAWLAGVDALDGVPIATTLPRAVDDQGQPTWHTTGCVVLSALATSTPPLGGQRRSRVQVDAFAYRIGEGGDVRPDKRRAAQLAEAVVAAAAAPSREQRRLVTRAGYGDAHVDAAEVVNGPTLRPDASGFARYHTDVIIVWQPC